MNRRFGSFAPALGKGWVDDFWSLVQNDVVDTGLFQ